MSDDKCIQEKLKELLAESEDGQFYQVVLLDNRCPKAVVYELMRIADQVGKHQGWNALFILTRLQEMIMKMTIAWINEVRK